MGVWPKKRLYSRLNCLGLSYSTSKVALAGAAPISSVNMMAINCGVIGGWRHTLARGIGSVAGENGFLVGDFVVFLPHVESKPAKDTHIDVCHPDQ